MELNPPHIRQLLSPIRSQQVNLNTEMILGLIKWISMNRWVILMLCFRREVMEDERNDWIRHLDPWTKQPVFVILKMEPNQCMHDVVAACMDVPHQSFTKWVLPFIQSSKRPSTIGTPNYRWMMTMRLPHRTVSWMPVLNLFNHQPLRIKWRYRLLIESTMPTQTSRF